MSSTPTEGANAIQHGGDHYKTATGLQHWDLIARYNVPYLEGNATKYIYRWRKKNGLEDLKKCLHYIQKVIELFITTGYSPDTIEVPLQVFRDFCDANGVGQLEKWVFAKCLYWMDEEDLRSAELGCKRLIWGEENGKNPYDAPF